jgi:hypothetical protein
VGRTLIDVQKQTSKKMIAIAAVAAVMFGLGGPIGSATAAGSATSTSAKGVLGQTLTASIGNEPLPANKTTDVTVSGKSYRLKTGIYATYCVIPKKGKKPEHCGAYNPTGINTQAHWISNNPPFYAALLAKKFGKGGTFKVTLPIGSTIGEYDCTKVKCAILTRADHTNSSYRKADVIIPVTFKQGE